MEIAGARRNSSVQMHSARSECWLCNRQPRHAGLLNTPSSTAAQITTTATKRQTAIMVTVLLLGRLLGIGSGRLVGGSLPFITCSFERRSMWDNRDTFCRFCDLFPERGNTGLPGWFQSKRLASDPESAVQLQQRLQ
jgi:hypothetical protein